MAQLSALREAIIDQRGGDDIVPSLEAMAGLIEPWGGRARRVLAALLRGHSRRQAALAAGVDNDTLRAWAVRVPAWGEAMRQAEEWGFGAVIEGELYRRALAGQEDRGSMRALELIVRARDPQYREKAALQIELVSRAHEAAGRAFGWDGAGGELDAGDGEAGEANL